jgi:hypothetical protein
VLAVGSRREVDSLVNLLGAAVVIAAAAAAAAAAADDEAAQLDRDDGRDKSSGRQHEQSVAATGA